MLTVGCLNPLQREDALSAQIGHICLDFTEHLPFPELFIEENRKNPLKFFKTVLVSLHFLPFSSPVVVLACQPGPRPRMSYGWKRPRGN